MDLIMKGKVVWQFDDNFNADLIVGSEFINERDPKILGEACLASFVPDFYKTVEKGDLMIAGRNFGYGHPHYQGIVSLQTVGIPTLIAESFYPMWYRVALFQGFPPVVCPDISKKAKIGDHLEVNIQTGEITNLTTKETLKGEPMPDFLLEIIEAGGQVPYLKKITAEKSE
ncbi:3-isopropylmalate dehydratase [Chloroflexota bacterium]